MTDVNETFKALSAKFLEWYGDDIEKAEALRLVDYELATLRSENARLRGVVKSLEWGSCDGCGNRTYCTECSGGKFNNWDKATSQYLPGRHAEDCPVFTEKGEVR